MRDIISMTFHQYTCVWCLVYLCMMPCIPVYGALYTCVWCLVYLCMVPCIPVYGALYTCVWCLVYLCHKNQIHSYNLFNVNHSHAHNKSGLLWVSCRSVSGFLNIGIPDTIHKCTEETLWLVTSQYVTNNCLWLHNWLFTLIYILTCLI